MSTYQFDSKEAHRTDWKKWSSVAPLALMSLLLGVMPITAEQADFFCYHLGKSYKFSIDSERQKAVPKWDVKRQQNPPLSAASELERARRFISRIEPGRDRTWEIGETSLIDVYGWLWKVRFRLASPIGWNGPPHYMDCYILMDGTMVKPVIANQKQD